MTEYAAIATMKRGDVFIDDELPDGTLARWIVRDVWQERDGWFIVRADAYEQGLTEIEPTRERDWTDREFQFAPTALVESEGAAR